MVRVILLSFIVIIFSLNAQSQHNPTDVVKFRNNLMNLLKYNISSIAQHAKGEVDYIDNIKIYAKSIVDLLEKADHLFIEGTDVFRLNFSHGAIEEHRNNIKIIRR